MRKKWEKHAIRVDLTAVWLSMVWSENDANRIWGWWSEVCTECTLYVNIISRVGVFWVTGSFSEIRQNNRTTYICHQTITIFVSILGAVVQSDGWSTIERWILTFFKILYIWPLTLYVHYKCFNPFSSGTIFIRQNLTYKDGPRTERVNGPLASTSPNAQIAAAIHNFQVKKPEGFCVSVMYVYEGAQQIRDTNQFQFNFGPMSTTPTQH